MPRRKVTSKSSTDSLEKYVDFAQLSKGIVALFFIIGVLVACFSVLNAMAQAMGN